jgi:hypothetical protein
LHPEAKAETQDAKLGTPAKACVGPFKIKAGRGVDCQRISTLGIVVALVPLDTDRWSEEA